MKTVRAYVDGCYVGEFDLTKDERASDYGMGMALLRFAKERGISPVGVSLRPHSAYSYQTNMQTGETRRVYEKAEKL
jgi:hypothetical protein